MSKTPKTSNGNAYKGIVRELDQVCAIGGNRPSRVFEDWVRLCEYTQRRIPSHIAQIGIDGNGAQDDAEGIALWNECIVRHRKKSFDHFHNAYHILIDYASDYIEWGDMGVNVQAGEEGRYFNGPDLLGPLHMNYGYANEYAGQFFTPWPVCKLMAQMIAPTDLLWVNLKEGAKKAAAADAGIDALLSVFALMGSAFDKEDGFDQWKDTFLWDKLLPLIIPYTTPISFNEPCCGSGTLVLAYALQFPAWARAAGLVPITAMDIDEFCVTMTRLNCMLYGVSGEHIRHILALTSIERAGFPERTRKLIDLAAEKGVIDAEIINEVQAIRYQQMTLF